MKIIRNVYYLYALLLTLSALTFVQFATAQMPTVYFNKVFTATKNNNSVSIVAPSISGTNFKFVGDQVDANGDFVESNGTIPGKFIYFNTSGNSVIHSGKINLRDNDNNGIYGFLFENTAGTTLFYLTNPAFDAVRTASATYGMNSGVIGNTLNKMRKEQVVLQTNYFLTNFSTCINTASSAQTFKVSGSNFVANTNVTITAPTNFEVSKTGTNDYASSITFSTGSGTLASSTVYLRLKSIASVGSYSGSIKVSATNAATQDLLATGDVISSTTISTHPQSIAICSGAPTNFTVVASGSNLTYQWQESTNGGVSFTDLVSSTFYSGTTSSVLQLSSSIDASYNGKQFRCRVKGSCGNEVFSNAATLTVNSSPSITSHPVSASICTNTNTSFSVSATGSGLYYKWQVSTNGGSSFSDLTNTGIYSGVSTATLSLTGATSGLTGYQYRCIVSGSCSPDATSFAAILTVNSTPGIPGNISGYSSICNNTNQTYSVNPVAGATSYTWELPSGWTGSSITNFINVINSSTSGDIKVKANNSCGTSPIKVLSVVVSNLPAPTPSFTINNQEQCLSGNSFSFTNSSTAAVGTTITNYTWNVGDGSSTISNSNVSNKSYASSGSYLVELNVSASNGCVSVLTKEIKVNSAPTAKISGATSICNGRSTSLTIELTGTGPWLVDYTGALSPISVNSSPYSFNVSPSSTTTYTLKTVSDAKCAAQNADLSGSAIVTVNANQTPSVSVSASPGLSVCSNTNVTFTAGGLANQGSSPSYQWYKNGELINNAISNTYSTNALSNGDAISVQLTSNATGCLTNNTVVSDQVNILIAPAPTTPLAISGSVNQCSGLTNQIYTVADVLHATSYTWSLPTGWSITSGSGTNKIIISLHAQSAVGGNISVTASNGCGTSSEQLLPVQVTSSGTNPITLSSAVGTDSQSRCIGTAITNITYTSSGGTGANFSGLPEGVTGSYVNGNITISGTPTQTGTFNYVVTLTGGSCSYTRTGTIVINELNTITLTSPANTSSQTVCIQSAIHSITYSTTGATGISNNTGLPNGVTANLNSNIVTISGTPTVSGTFNYTITLTGGCGSITATGTINVTAAQTINLSSGAGSNSPTVCIGSAMTSITYSSSGASDAIFNGLPTGVTGSYNAGSISISGSPTLVGTNNYTISLTGGCGAASATGTVTVASLPAPVSITNNNSPVCSGFDAQFSVSGIANGILTYQINTGSDQTITLANGSGNGTITSSSISAEQVLTLISIKDASTQCVSSLSATSTVALRGDYEWTGKGNSQFHVQGNWCNDKVPGTGSNIIIPVVGNGRYPQLNNSDAVVSNMQIDNGAQIDLNGRKITINGALTGTGVFKGSSSSIIEFSGNGNVGTIYLDPSSDASKTIGSLKIDRSGGSLILGNNMIVNSLDLTSGKIEIGNNDLVLNSVSNASGSSYVKISGTGKVKKSISNGSSFTFPVGNSTYNPLTILNNNSSSDIFSVNLLDDVYTSYDVSGQGTNAVTSTRVKRTWNIFKTNSNSGTIDLVFNWNSGDVYGSLTNPALFHFESGTWVKQTGNTTLGTNSLTYTGYTGSFSPFSIVQTDAALPVSWLSFTATKSNGGVTLNWSTASEQNTKDFDVQYSTNGITWNSIGVVPAAGNSSTEKKYHLIHPTHTTGTLYYRIKQNDLDGKSSYSKVVTVTVHHINSLLVYPNPVQDILLIQVQKEQMAKLISSNGTIVWTSKLASGRNEVNVSSFPRGTYVLHTETGSKNILLQ